MINSDQIHVAMTKLCGLVAILVCQSNNLFIQLTMKKKRKNIVMSLSSFFFVADIFSLDAHYSRTDDDESYVKVKELHHLSSTNTECV